MFLLRVAINEKRLRNNSLVNRCPSPKVGGSREGGGGRRSRKEWEKNVRGGGRDP